MDIKRIEEYSFSHGLHRDNSTGRFISLHPHALGRSLTHSEMDYNMLYMAQTLGGYKIFGANNDTTLSDADVDKSLILHRITAQDSDYARYTANGYFSDNELIWIPSCCGDSDSGQSCTIGVTALAIGQASQGVADANIIVFITGLQGAPSFSINGNLVTPSSANGSQYTFNGYGAGTYSIIVVDTGVTDYTCDANATVVITETVDVCSTFAVSLQVQDSGIGEDPVVCNLEVVGILVSNTLEVGYGEEDGSAVIEIDGTWTGPLTWSVRKNNVVTSIVPQLVAGNQFSLSGLGGGNWNITVIDAGVPGGTCYQSWTFTIAEEANPCDTFDVSISTQDSGGDNHTNEICQDFNIHLSLVQESGGQSNGELLLELPSGSWGSLSIDYTTTDPFDSGTVWTSVDSIIPNGDGTYNLRPFSAGRISIRVIESNNSCLDIETIDMP